MNFKKLNKTLARPLAAAGIISTLNAAVRPPDATPNLNSQYAKYAKQVRLSETGRTIRRTTTKTNIPTATLDPRTTRKLRKP